jgi:hypothetical protein
MDVAPPKRGGRRPKAPEVEFSGAEVKIAITGAGDANTSPPPPEVVVAAPVDHSFSRDTSDDTEPVSISDLEAIFQPGHAPPLWASEPAPADLAPSSAPASAPISAPVSAPISAPVSAPISAPVSAPISAPIDSAPSSFQPVSDRDLLFENSRLDTPAPVAVRPRPAFFDVDDEPAPRSRLFDAEPAPFDPHVPALPVRLEAPMFPEERNTSSGLLDIRSLVALDNEQHPKNKRDDNRADDDIFNLSGGLFASGGGGPLVEPDLGALIGPVLPESSRPGPLLASSKASPPRPKAAPATATATKDVDAGPLGASAPVVSERRATPAAAAASQRSARAGWAVAIATLGVGLMLVSLKLGKSSTLTTTVMASETATLPIVAVETTRPALPIAPTPPAAIPEPTVAARDPGVSAKRDKDPIAAIPATSAPRSTTLAATPTTATPPVVTAPAATAPVVAPPIVIAPPPSSGAEFDQSAARAALAAAAGRALGCKQPDDPSGGASVSVTFAPSGRVTSSKVTSAPFQGTVMGGCIASAFRSASVPPFEGAPVTVTKNVSIR